MSRIFCHARLADGLEEVPTKRWQPLHERDCWRKIEWVLEADLKNFFGSLSHEWMLRFVEHRVGDQRLISLIRRWLKAGVLEKWRSPSKRRREPRRGVRSACC
jgi:RNA-directed DNA polymerase